MKKEGQPYNQLPDGSWDFGNGVISPSLSDRNHFNSVRESRKGKANRLTLPVTTAVLGAISLACSRGANKNTVENTRELEKEPSGYALPFPEGETWFLTNGPHGDGYSNGIKYAIDIAPPELGRLNGNCPIDGSRLSIDNRVVTASASGEVIKKGDDKSRNDPYHSEVRIKDKSGLTQVYIHLDNTKVNLRDKVKQGAPLGNPSCEYPPGGANTGPHVHVGLMKDGKAIPIDGVVVGGWTIHEDGTMTKPGEKIRAAGAGRSGEDYRGIRNDLPNNPNRAVVALPKDPIPPISATTTSKEVFTPTPPPPTPTAIPTPKPTETPKPAVVEKKASLSKKPDELYRALLTNPISSDVLPQGMSLRGTSAGEIDATGKALKQVGAVNILIEDSVLANDVWKTPGSGKVFYGIFPDSSTAKSASELIGTHLGNGEVLEDFPYPAKIYTNEINIGGVTLMSTKVLVISVNNVTVIVSLTNANARGADGNLVHSRAVSLAHAAIEHLAKVGR